MSSHMVLPPPAPIPPRSYANGWPIIFLNDQWVYDDETREPTTTKRPCARCGKLPTQEGYDACLGSLPGVLYACCGHGVTESYAIVARSKAKKFLACPMADKIVRVQYRYRGVYTGKLSGPSGKPLKGETATLTTRNDHEVHALFDDYLSTGLYDAVLFPADEWRSIE